MENYELPDSEKRKIQANIEERKALTLDERILIFQKLYRKLPKVIELLLKTKANTIKINKLLEVAITKGLSKDGIMLNMITDQLALNRAEALNLDLQVISEKLRKFEGKLFDISMILSDQADEISDLSFELIEQFESYYADDVSDLFDTTEDDED